LRICLNFDIKFSIIPNKMKIGYRIQNTGDRMEKAGIRKSGNQEEY
jgi:hypothetical protein